MDSPAVALTVETQRAPTPKLDTVLYEKRSGISYVTLNRPKVLNALNSATWKDLRTVFEDAGDDAAVRYRRGR
jgi:enoyl-CoA hydratase